MKRSRVSCPRPTPEGSLTLVSILLGRVVNRGFDLGNLTKFKITKY